MRQFGLRTLLLVVMVVAVAMGTYRWLKQPRVVAHATCANVTLGSSGTCRFTIENTSLFDVRIEPAASPCTGTFVDWSGQVIPARETRDIAVAWHVRNPDRAIGGTVPGKPIVWNYGVATDDRNVPWLVLTVVGNPPSSKSLHPTATTARVMESPSGGG
jgi:hypothetical protein